MEVDEKLNQKQLSSAQNFDHNIICKDANATSTASAPSIGGAYTSQAEFKVLKWH